MSEVSMIVKAINKKYGYRIQESESWGRIGRLVNLFGEEVALQAIEDNHVIGKGIQHLCSILTNHCKRIIENSDVDFDDL